MEDGTVGGRTVTLKDLANEIGIHPSTVSRILHSGSDVARGAASVATAERVRDLARVRGYSPNPNAVLSGESERATANAMADAVLAANRINDRLGAFHATDRVRKLLGGISRQAVSERVKNDRLLRVTTADGVGLFPPFQFANGVMVPGLQNLLKTLLGTGVDGWTVAYWLTARLAQLGETTALDVLASGAVVSPRWKDLRPVMPLVGGLLNESGFGHTSTSGAGARLCGISRLSSPCTRATISRTWNAPPVVFFQLCRSLQSGSAEGDTELRLDRAKPPCANSSAWLLWGTLPFLRQ